MKNVVLFDSYFGNTQKIAEAIGQAIGARVMKVQEAKPEGLAGLDFLVVGSPTRAFRPTPELINFLKALPIGSLVGVRAAAFDTRIDLSKIEKPALRNFLTLLVRMFGYAEKPLANILRVKGAQVLDMAGFFVKDTEGPLLDGEIERAKKWAEELKSK